MQSLAFPLRVQENGLLQRDNRAAAVVALLRVMGQTPQGSWAGCPSFGLRDLFENTRQRAELPRLLTERIEATFEDLGITGYHVAEIVREVSARGEADQFAITLANADGTESLTTAVSHE